MGFGYVRACDQRRGRMVPGDARVCQGMSVFPLWQVQATHCAWEHQQARVRVHWLIAPPAWGQAYALAVGKLT